MNLKKTIILILVMAGLSATGFPELVENGDFSKGISNWQLTRSPDYGPPDPDFYIADGALEGRRLHGTKGPYVILSQAVNIREGKRYKFTCEVRGEGHGSPGVSLGHPRKKMHFNRKITLTPSWQVIEAEFAGKYDTDINWYGKWHKITRKSELKNGKTSDHREIVELNRSMIKNEPTFSSLLISLGGLEGTFAIRKVSMVEVE